MSTPSRSNAIIANLIRRDLEIPARWLISSQLLWCASSTRTDQVFIFFDNDVFLDRHWQGFTRGSSISPRQKLHRLVLPEGVPSLDSESHPFRFRQPNASG